MTWDRTVRFFCSSVEFSVDQILLLKKLSGKISIRSARERREVFNRRRDSKSLLNCRNWLSHDWLSQDINHPLFSYSFLLKFSPFLISPKFFERNLLSFSTSICNMLHHMHIMYDLQPLFVTWSISHKPGLIMAFFPATRRGITASLTGKEKQKGLGPVSRRSLLDKHELLKSVCISKHPFKPLKAKWMPGLF